jgi:hypothetical protein
MRTELLQEEKHALLKNELRESLQKKHALELKIARQFEGLKRLEIALEKRARNTKAEERTRTVASKESGVCESTNVRTRAQGKVEPTRISSFSARGACES